MAVNILNHKDLPSFCGTLLAVRILLDYRPALRERTGVGEYVHELARALAAPAGAPDDQSTLFTSSWKDRPARGSPPSCRRRAIVDRRVPVRLLNWSWHRLDWPPVEWLAGARRRRPRRRTRC